MRNLHVLLSTQAQRRVLLPRMQYTPAGRRVSERRCNECTLCCKLVPVAELAKPANVRCGFVRAGKGCVVHGSASYPRSCARWACVWLKEPDLPLPRPDRAHYVIDPFLDFIELECHGQRERIDVVQVWVDPKYPDAYRDPALRAYLADRAERLHQAALVRFNSRDALTLFAPPMTTTGEWIEEASGTCGRQHSMREIYK